LCVGVLEFYSLPLCLRQIDLSDKYEEFSMERKQHETNHSHQTMPWPKWIVTIVSLQKPAFNLRALQVEFVVDRLTLS
jgi:hypothetical protein